MKKSVILILILIVFPIISAVSFDIKTNFSQGETFLAKVSGDFSQPLTEQDISFYRRHMQTSIIPKITKVDNEFHIYASLEGKTSDNYSIIINEDSQNFTITKDIADFSINLGFIITNKDFFIEVENLQGEEKTITRKFNNKEEQILFLSKETKKINFEIKDIDKTSLKTIELSTENLKYEILAYIFVSKIETSEEAGQNISEETEGEEEIIAPEPEEITSVSITKTCSEMQGIICKTNEKCDGESSYAKDSVCCLGTCEEIESDDGWKIVGWGLLGLVLIIIFYIWNIKRKYSKAKTKIDLLKNVKKRK